MRALHKASGTHGTWQSVATILKPPLCMHLTLIGCRACNPHPSIVATHCPRRLQVLASLRLDSRVVCARFSPFDDLLLAVATPTSLGQYRMDVEHDTLKQVAAPPVGSRWGLPGSGGRGATGRGAGARETARPGAPGDHAGGKWLGDSEQMGVWTSLVESRALLGGTWF